MADQTPHAIFAFECTVQGTDWHRVIHARTPGQAKGEYWRHVTDAWPDIPFTAIRCRKIGVPVQNPEFAKVAKYRGLPHARIGMRVRADGRVGVIVGHNSSANFDVLFDGEAHPWNVHPHGLTLLPEVSR